MRPTPKQVLALTALAVVAIAFFVTQAFTRGAPGSVAREGAVITRVMTAAETDASADYTVRLLEGSDADHESTHMFQAIDGIQGIGTASLDVDDLVLTVNYDSSVVTADIIRSALAASGYVARTTADAIPMELSEDGTVQRIEIIDDHGFKPSFIKAAAGVPAEITFGPGTECRVVVKFPDLGIVEDISQGGVVSLPALEPGTYPILCGGDGDEGSIIVE